MSHAKYFVTKKNLLSTTRAVLDISPNRVLVRVVGTHEVLFDTNGEELAHVEREGSSSFRLRSGRAKIKLSCDDAVAVVAALKLHMDQNPEIMEAKLKSGTSAKDCSVYLSPAGFSMHFGGSDGHQEHHSAVHRSLLDITKIECSRDNHNVVVWYADRLPDVLWFRESHGFAGSIQGRRKTLGLPPVPLNTIADLTQYNRAEAAFLSAPPNDVVAFSAPVVVTRFSSGAPEFTSDSPRVAVTRNIKPLMDLQTPHEGKAIGGYLAQLLVTSTEVVLLSSAEKAAKVLWRWPLYRVQGIATYAALPHVAETMEQRQLLLDDPVSHSLGLLAVGIHEPSSGAFSSKATWCYGAAFSVKFNDGCFERFIAVPGLAQSLPRHAARGATVVPDYATAGKTHLSRTAWKVRELLVNALQSQCDAARTGAESVAFESELSSLKETEEVFGPTRAPYSTGATSRHAALWTRFRTWRTKLLSGSPPKETQSRRHQQPGSQDIGWLNGTSDIEPIAIASDPQAVPPLPYGDLEWYQGRVLPLKTMTKGDASTSSTDTSSSVLDSRSFTEAVHAALQPPRKLLPEAHFALSTPHLYWPGESGVAGRSHEKLSGHWLGPQPVASPSVGTTQEALEKLWEGAAPSLLAWCGGSVEDQSRSMRISDLVALLRDFNNSTAAFLFTHPSKNTVHSITKIVHSLLSGLADGRISVSGLQLIQHGEVPYRRSSAVSTASSQQGRLAQGGRSDVGSQGEDNAAHISLLSLTTRLLRRCIGTTKGLEELSSSLRKRTDIIEKCITVMQKLAEQIRRQPLQAVEGGSVERTDRALFSPVSMARIGAHGVQPVGANSLTSVGMWLLMNDVASVMSLLLCGPFGSSGLCDDSSLDHYNPLPHHDEGQNPSVNSLGTWLASRQKRHSDVWSRDRSSGWQGRLTKPYWRALTAIRKMLLRGDTVDRLVIVVERAARWRLQVAWSEPSPVKDTVGSDNPSAGPKQATRSGTGQPPLENKEGQEEEVKEEPETVQQAGGPEGAEAEEGDTAAATVASDIDLQSDKVSEAIEHSELEAFTGVFLVEIGMSSVRDDPPLTLLQPLLLSLSATCLQVAGLESKAKTALSNRLQRLPRPAVAPVSDSEALVPPSVLATATQRGLCYPVPYLFRTLASLARCGDWSTAVCATQIMEHWIEDTPVTSRPELLLFVIDSGLFIHSLYMATPPRLPTSNITAEMKRLNEDEVLLAPEDLLNHIITAVAIAQRASSASLRLRSAALALVRTCCSAFPAAVNIIHAMYPSEVLPTLLFAVQGRDYHSIVSTRDFDEYGRPAATGGHGGAHEQLRALGLSPHTNWHDGSGSLVSGTARMGYDDAEAGRKGKKGPAVGTPTVEAAVWLEHALQRQDSKARHAQYTAAMVACDWLELEMRHAGALVTPFVVWPWAGKVEQLVGLQREIEEVEASREWRAFATAAHGENIAARDVGPAFKEEFVSRFAEATTSYFAAVSNMTLVPSLMQTSLGLTGDGGIVPVGTHVQQQQITGLGTEFSVGNMVPMELHDIIPLSDFVWNVYSFHVSFAAASSMLRVGKFNLPRLLLLETPRMDRETKSAAESGQDKELATVSNAPVLISNERVFCHVPASEAEFFLTQLYLRYAGDSDPGVRIACLRVMRAVVRHYLDQNISIPFLGLTVKSVASLETATSERDEDPLISMLGLANMRWDDRLSRAELLALLGIWREAVKIGETPLWQWMQRGGLQITLCAALQAAAHCAFLWDSDKPTEATSASDASETKETEAPLSEPFAPRSVDEALVDTTEPLYSELALTALGVIRAVIERVWRGYLNDPSREKEDAAMRVPVGRMARVPPAWEGLTVASDAVCTVLVQFVGCIDSTIHKQAVDTLSTLLAMKLDLHHRDIHGGSKFKGTALQRSGLVARLLARSPSEFSVGDLKLLKLADRMEVYSGDIDSLVERELETGSCCSYEAAAALLCASAASPAAEPGSHSSANHLSSHRVYVDRYMEEVIIRNRFSDEELEETSREHSSEESPTCTDKRHYPLSILAPFLPLGIIEMLRAGNKFMESVELYNCKNVMHGDIAAYPNATWSHELRRIAMDHSRRLLQGISRKIVISGVTASVPVQLQWDSKLQHASSVCKFPPLEKSVPRCFGLTLPVLLQPPFALSYPLSPGRLLWCLRELHVKFETALTEESQLSSEAIHSLTVHLACLSTILFRLTMWLQCSIVGYKTTVTKKVLPRPGSRHEAKEAEASAKPHLLKEGNAWWNAELREVLWFGSIHDALGNDPDSVPQEGVSSVLLPLIAAATEDSQRLLLQALTAVVGQYPQQRADDTAAAEATGGAAILCARTLLHLSSLIQLMPNHPHRDGPQLQGRELLASTILSLRFLHLLHWKEGHGEEHEPHLFERSQGVAVWKPLAADAAAGTKHTLPSTYLPPIHAVDPVIRAWASSNTGDEGGDFIKVPGIPEYVRLVPPRKMKDYSYCHWEGIARKLLLAGAGAVAQLDAPPTHFQLRLPHRANATPSTASDATELENRMLQLYHDINVKEGTWHGDQPKLLQAATHLASVLLLNNDKTFEAAHERSSAVSIGSITVHPAPLTQPSLKFLLEIVMVAENAMPQAIEALAPSGVPWRLLHLMLACSKVSREGATAALCLRQLCRLLHTATQIGFQSASRRAGEGIEVQESEESKFSDMEGSPITNEMESLASKLLIALGATLTPGVLRRIIDIEDNDSQIVEMLLGSEIGGLDTHWSRSVLEEARARAFVFADSPDEKPTWMKAAQVFGEQGIDDLVAIWTSDFTVSPARDLLREAATAGTLMLELRKDALPLACRHEVFCYGLFLNRLDCLFHDRMEPQLFYHHHGAWPTLLPAVIAMSLHEWMAYTVDSLPLLEGFSLPKAKDLGLRDSSHKESLLQQWQHHYPNAQEWLDGIIACCGSAESQNQGEAASSTQQWYGMKAEEALLLEGMAIHLHGLGEAVKGGVTPAVMQQGSMANKPSTAFSQRSSLHLSAPSDVSDGSAFVSTITGTACLSYFSKEVLSDWYSACKPHLGSTEAMIAALRQRPKDTVMTEVRRLGLATRLADAACNACHAIVWRCVEENSMLLASDSSRDKRGEEAQKVLQCALVSTYLECELLLTLSLYSQVPSVADVVAPMLRGGGDGPLRGLLTLVLLHTAHQKWLGGEESDTYDLNINAVTTSAIACLLAGKVKGTSQGDLQRRFRMLGELASNGAYLATEANRWVPEAPAASDAAGEEGAVAACLPHILAFLRSTLKSTTPEVLSSCSDMAQGLVAMEGTSSNITNLDVWRLDRAMLSESENEAKQGVVLEQGSDVPEEPQAGGGGRGDNATSSGGEEEKEEREGSEGKEAGEAEEDEEVDEGDTETAEGSEAEEAQVTEQAATPMEKKDTESTLDEDVKESTPESKAPSAIASPKTAEPKGVEATGEPAEEEKVHGE